MSRLEELIAEHCPDGVEYKKLNELLNYEQPTKYIVEKADYNDEGIGIPVLTAGKSLLLGYTEETEGIYEVSQDQSVIIFDDFTTSFHWISNSFKVKSSALKIITPKEDSEKDCSFRYVYYAMRSLNFQRGGHRRYWIREYSNLTIPLPPIDVQNEIVRILDTFTELTHELTHERELREKQYDYYRDTLLTFDDDVEMKKLGDVCEIMNGYAFQSKHYDTEGVRIIRISDVQDGYLSSHDEKYYNREMFEDAQLDRYLLEHSDIVMSMTGNVGRVAYIKESDSGKIALNQRVAGIKHKLDDVNMRYIYYYLSRNSFMELAQNNSTGGGQKNLGINWIRDYQVPIPPIEVQNEIVEKLDRFNTLANDINHGLPKEIELRQKQYEYYRDQLLTFDEVTA